MYFPQQEYIDDSIDAHNPDLLRIHSLETLGTHDGPGIRMVVFAQGCQFRCLYCQNPDTLDIHGGSFVPIEELVEKALNQKTYFGKKGGVTVSGGEPLLQREKLITFFDRLHENGINTCLDSNGRVLDSKTEQLLERTDLLLLDVKHINKEWHKKLTGLKNKTTLRVAEYRESTGKPMWLRYVLVPGWSDQEEYLHEWGQHFTSYKTVERVEIIPFHQLGKHKWELLGLEYQLADTVPHTKEEINKAAEIFKLYFKNVKIK
ncbi:pyruvate formate-lyase-activating protein [Flavobacterium granuli]|uniref:Pyruvate formate-lyase-activating enzyme n=1 Tax=Flavobacterium granuli TaxID=280093 RepID=A0ABU1S033_9FLAO|nr:pyruvate formate-lyase-activating protein [Flavobacterium granuli]MDR6844397.1 pyruvate formate lyase activating enzyme [Flavobacterium granuli]